MKPPAEFVQLAQCFYPGSYKKDATWDEWIASVLALGASQTRRRIAKRYLADLLASNASDDELKKIWDATNPTYGFTRGLRHFLTLLRDAL